jgi:hypothetical protein
MAGVCGKTGCAMEAVDASRKSIETVLAFSFGLQPGPRRVA